MCTRCLHIQTALAYAHRDVQRLSIDSTVCITLASCMFILFYLKVSTHRTPSRTVGLATRNSHGCDEQLVFICHELRTMVEAAGHSSVVSQSLPSASPFTIQRCPYPHMRPPLCAQPEQEPGTEPARGGEVVLEDVENFAQIVLAVLNGQLKTRGSGKNQRGEGQRRQRMGTTVNSRLGGRTG